jgi:hypothetical protein
VDIIFATCPVAGLMRHQVIDCAGSNCINPFIVLLNESIPNSIPYSDFFHYYSPEYQLHIPPSTAVNLNSRQYLESIKVRIMQNLSELEHAPSVQMHQVPSDFFTASMTEVNEDGELALDGSGRSKQAKINPNEYYDDSDDHDDDADRGDHLSNRA